MFVQSTCRFARWKTAFIDKIEPVNPQKQRFWMIISIAIAFLALILLSASLEGLTLDPGSRLPLADVTRNLVQGQEPDGFARFLMAVIRLLIIAGWVLLPFYIIYLILSKEARKRFLRDMLMLLPFLIILYLISVNATGSGLVEEVIPGLSQEPFELGDMPPTEEIPEYTEPPDWVTTVTSIILAATLTLLLAGLVMITWHRQRRVLMEPLRRVEREAQAAIDAIEAGGDLRDVILRCYIQMLQAVSEYRNITRSSDVTPHEFEQYLKQRGLPEDPIHQLTQLFEQVRYGGIRPGRQDERAAVASLAAIVSACQRTRVQERSA